MNKHIRTRLLSVLMALTLMLGLVPTAALAEGEDAAPETVAAEETVPETPETPEEAPETEEPDAEPAEDAEEPAEEAAEEADAAAVLAEESTLKEGTYTVTANLYVPGSENVILTGVAVYLTNTRVPPVSPVEKNAKLVVDADGNMTLTIKNLNPVFTLQRIEDAEGLKISQRFMEEGKFGSCTSRINGLEFQLLEKKDVYSFPDCEEMPCLNDHMSMLSMPLEL